MSCSRGRTSRSRARRWCTPRPEAVAAAAQYDRCFVIGGDSVFRQMFPHLTRVYVTKIDAAPHSDVFFPDLDADPAWRCVSSEPRAEHDGVGYQFCVYEKAKEKTKMNHFLAHMCVREKAAAFQTLLSGKRGALSSSSALTRRAP
ncbi:MAG: dihydrofolate reductase [Oscillospiraceae bacterium]